MKTVFLDRDGVINHDYGYTYKWDNFKFLDKSIEAMKLLNDNGFSIIIITNQSGIARGYYSEKDLLELHKEMEKYLGKFKVKIKDIFYCPHHPEGQITKYRIRCNCRKPGIGMLKEASKKYSLDLKECYLVGDKLSDIEAADRANISRAFLINKYIDTDSLCYKSGELEIISSLHEAALAILNN